MAKPTGAVLMFIDIDAAKRRSRLREAIVETVREPLVILQPEPASRESQQEVL